MPSNAAIEERASYLIQVRGVLDEKWAAWFDRFVIVTSEKGDSFLYGSVADQAALYGLLAKIRDLCLPLELVMRLNREQIESLNRGDYSWLETWIREYDIS